MTRRIALVALLAALCAAACSKSVSREVSPDDAARLLIDRNWIDVWPESKDDRIHVYRFVPKMGGGVYQDRTIFQGEFELFRFKTRGRELEMFLPHTGDRVKTTYTIEKVTGPEPFDLKLTLAFSPRGPATYYGMSREHDATGELLEARLAALSGR